MKKFYYIENVVTTQVPTTITTFVVVGDTFTGPNKKLSYCWETVRRESMPRIAEMDVEMTT